MLSEKSKKTVNACRFCCMCRHLCPLGLALGKELNNPRAKALLLSMIEKGSVQLPDVALDMYECCLCNACSENCETGYEPAVFIREIRSLLVAEGLAPQPALDMIDRLLQDGTLYGINAGKTLEHLKVGAEPGKKVLVYVGAAAAVKNPETMNAFFNLLKKADVDFSVFRENNSTGASEYDLMGEIQETKDVAAVCAELINGYKAKTVVVLNPTDARMMKQEYSKWGIALNCEVFTATTFVDQLIRDHKLNITKTSGTVTFHDPCRLARDLEETEPARQIIKAMGYDIKEMWQSKELTKCCGGEIMAAYSPKIAEKTAKGRMENAKGTEAEMLVCACPCCETNMKLAQGIPVTDIFIMLDGLAQ